MVCIFQNGSFYKVELNHFGCSSSVFDQPYLALAAAVGMEESEIDKLIAKLTDIFGKIKTGKWYRLDSALYFAYSVLWRDSASEMYIFVKIRLLFRLLYLILKGFFLARNRIAETDWKYHIFSVDGTSLLTLSKEIFQLGPFCAYNRKFNRNIWCYKLISTDNF